MPPGGAGDVKTTFKTKGYQGVAKKTITVESNDPLNPRVRLVLTGKIVTDVTVAPRHLNFGNVNKNELPEPLKLELSFREGKAIKIKDVSSENEAVVLEKISGDEKGEVYSVALTSPLPIGRLTGRIVIQTDSKKNSMVKVPFHAVVQGDVKVSPQLLSFGMIRPGKTSTRSITLQKTGKNDFSVEKVKKTSDQLTTEIVTEKEGQQYLIKVTYDPENKTRGRVSERLTIYIKSEEEEILEIPVYGTIHLKEKRAAPKTPAK